jgi:hypothetical protein
LDKITEETLVGDEALRKKLIAGFDKGDNARRKAEAFKGYECLKDHTDNYVVEQLLHQFDPATVQEMQYAISNISILRKVIDKLAKVYSNGVTRSIGDSKKSTEQLEEAAKIFRVDEAMRKTNRYFRTFKNTFLYVRPQREEDDRESVKLEVKAPFSYDVIEHPDDCTRPLAIILSDYRPSRQSRYYLGDAANAGREKNVGKVIDSEYGEGIVAQSYHGSGKVAGEEDHEDHRQFVWWTKNYHFTTNAKGKILPEYSEEGNKNPIQELPFVNFAGEQDASFWADGGKDLIDSGVNINLGLTNAKHIAVTQGFGQLYMTGHNLPKAVKVGPNHCVQLEHDKEAPNPTIGYLNSNPPLADLKAQIEMDVALMLSTNNLSAANFSTSLGSGEKFASGIAMWIDKSESIEDVAEQSKIFIEKEPQVWKLIALWWEKLKSLNVLIESQQKAKLPPAKQLDKLQTRFEPSSPIQSEGEALDNLKKRKELGINLMVELIMKDNPGMTQEDAEKKLQLIKEEQADAADEAMQREADAQAALAGDEVDGNQDEESSGKPAKNRGGNRPGVKPEDTGARGKPDQE